MYKKIVFLFAVIMIMCTSCNRQSFFPEVDVSDSITESGNITNEIPIALNESENFNQEFNGELDLERLKIFGTWSLDKIILSSKEYTGEKNWEMVIYLKRRSILDMKSSTLLITFV